MGAYFLFQNQETNFVGHCIVVDPADSGRATSHILVDFKSLNSTLFGLSEYFLSLVMYQHNENEISSSSKVNRYPSMYAKLIS